MRKSTNVSDLFARDRILATLKRLPEIFLWLHRHLFVMCARHRVPPVLLLGGLLIATRVFQVQYPTYSRPLLLFGLAQLWALAALFLPNRRDEPFLIIHHPLLPGRLDIHLNSGFSAMIARRSLPGIAKLAKACKCHTLTMDSPLLARGPTQRCVAMLMERAFRKEEIDAEVFLGDVRPWSAVFSCTFRYFYAEQLAKLSKTRIQRVGRWRIASSVIVVRQRRHHP